MFLLGNILSLLGQSALTASGLVKDRLRTLLVQTIGIGLLSVANFVLGGVVGGVVNLVNMTRNIVWYRGKGGLAAKIVLTVVLCALSAIGSDDGFLWLFPAASGLVFLWFIDLDGWKFKLMVLVSTALWLPYDLMICNYVAVAFDSFGVVFNAITAVKLRLDERGRQEWLKDLVDDSCRQGTKNEEARWS